MGAKGYRAVWKNGKLVAEYENGVLTYVDTAYYASNRSDTVKAPMVMRDMGEYVSPLDGSIVGSRSVHREHMRTHDVVEVGNEKIGNMTAAVQNAPVAVDRDLGEAIKRRLDEVAAMSQRQYDEHAVQQSAEHEAIGALVVADAA